MKHEKTAVSDGARLPPFRSVPHRGVRFDLAVHLRAREGMNSSWSQSNAPNVFKVICRAFFEMGTGACLFVNCFRVCFDRQSGSVVLLVCYNDDEAKQSVS